MLKDDVVRQDGVSQSDILGLPDVKVFEPSHETRLISDITNLALKLQSDPSGTLDTAERFVTEAERLIQMQQELFAGTDIVAAVASLKELVNLQKAKELERVTGDEAMLEKTSKFSLGGVFPTLFT